MVIPCKNYQDMDSSVNEIKQHNTRNYIYFVMEFYCTQVSNLKTFFPVSASLSMQLYSPQNSLVSIISVSQLSFLFVSDLSNFQHTDRHSSVSTFYTKEYLETLPVYIIAIALH